MQQPSTDSSEFLTRKQVATWLNVCPMTILRLTKRGKLPVIKLGKHCIRYRREDVQALINNHMNDQQAAA